MVGILRRQREEAIAAAPGAIFRVVAHDRAGCRAQHAREQLEQRGLAGAVRPGETIGLPRREPEIRRAKNLATVRIAERQLTRADGGGPGRRRCDAREIAGEIRAAVRKLAPRPAGWAGEPVVDQRDAKSLVRA